jgi:DNA-binding MarR family transcriptional regulator
MRFEFLLPLHKASRQIGLFLEQPCAALGVSTGEGHLLSYLRSYEPASVGVVAQVFGHPASTMTSMLDRLAERGLIDRRPGLEDRRTVILTLTRRGRVTADRLREGLVDLESRIRAGASPRDLQGFRAVLDAIARATTLSTEKETSR